MISERTLRQWRREALKITHIPTDKDTVTYLHFGFEESKQRILRLTQDLMDFHLMKKG